MKLSEMKMFSIYRYKNTIRDGGSTIKKTAYTDFK